MNMRVLLDGGCRALTIHRKKRSPRLGSPKRGGRAGEIDRGEVEPISAEEVRRKARALLR